MDNNSFLKKFQGRTELIGKEGLLGVMNNVHINVNDYKCNQKPKKQTKLQRPNPKDQYNYISSEISREFNKNKNFIPQLKSATNRISNNRENNKNSSNNSQNKMKNKSEISYNNNMNSPKRNKKKNNESNIVIENRINRYINNTKEKPIKLFKSFDQNINNNPNKFKSQNYLQEKPNKRPNNNVKKDVYSNMNVNNNNNRRNFSSKNREQNIRLNLKLPLIKSRLQENNTTKNSKQNVNKSYEKKNTFTPKIKNNILKKINFKNINTEESEERPRSLKKAIEGKMGSDKKKNKHNTFQGVSLSNKIKLPKINLNRNNNTSSKNLLNKNNNSKIYNSNQKNNDVLNNIKRDFMMLDSLKNHGQIQKNKSFKEKNEHKISINNNNQYKNRVSNNNNYNYNINNFNNNYNKVNNMNYLYNSNNNINSRNNMNKISRSYDDNQFYNDFNENRVNTSFGRPQRLQNFDDRLDIINEEEEDRFITNSQNNNFNDGNYGQNQNILEILMSQRRNYQNRLPNNSRFKLNVEN